MIAYLILGSFLLATLVIGFWSGKDVKTMKDYVLANRELKTGALAMTCLATCIGAGSLEYPTHVRLMGIINGIDLIVAAFACLLLGFYIAPKLVAFRNCLTLGDVMKELYGVSASIFISFIGSFTSVLIVTGQIMMLGRLSNHLLGLDQAYFLLIIILVLSVYMVAGGMRAVAYTDVLQLIALVGVVAWIANRTIGEVGGIKALVKNLSLYYPEKLSVYSHPDFSFLLFNKAFFWEFFLFLLPSLWLRMLMVQDKKQARGMFVATSFFYFMVHFLLILIGLSTLFLNLDISPSKPILVSIIQKFFSSELAKGLILTGLGSVVISTIDSFVHEAGISGVHNILTPIFGGRIRKKIIWIKVFCFLLSLSACTLVLLVENSPSKMVFYGLAIFSVPAVLLLIGIVGFKTDAKSFWISFSFGLLGSLVFWLFFYSFSGEQFTLANFVHTLLSRRLKYYVWLSAIIATGLVFFIQHVIRNQGFLLIQRNKHTVGYGLQLPSLRRFISRLCSYISTPSKLANISRQNVYAYGSNPTLFAWFILIFYMLPDLEGSLAGNSLILTLRTLGVALCCGLLLKELWPASLLFYFDLYWFFTLLFCLPFLGTLLFLTSSHSVTSLISLNISLLLLIVCVNSQSLPVLLTIGLVMAGLVYFLCEGHILPVLDFDTAWSLVVSIVLVLLTGLLFSRSKELYSFKKLRKAKLYAGSIAHETNNYLGVSMFAGDVIKHALDTKKFKRLEGKDEYVIPKELYENLVFLGPQLSVGAKQSVDKIKMFMSALREDILGTKKEVVSVRDCVEEALRDTYFQNTEVKKGLLLELEDDFSAKVSKSYFKHILYNIVKNAFHHGGASKVKICLDRAERKLVIRDDGAGISGEKLPYVFDLFYSAGGSTGIGLALVKVIVESFGSKVHVESKSGKNSFTEFSIAFG